MYGDKSNAVAGTLANAPIEPPSITERLKSERLRLEQRLQEIDVVLSQMEASPESAAIINGLSRLGHLPY